MTRPSFQELRQAAWAKERFLCVGFDTDVNHPHFPPTTGSPATQMLNYTVQLIEALAPEVSWYKFNYWFWGRHGERGVRALLNAIQYIRSCNREAIVILDFKGNDIGNSADQIVACADYYNVDAFTVNPYLGRAANAPFLNQTNKGIIVLCKTSNEESGEFQDLEIVVPDDFAVTLGVDMMPLYEYVAARVALTWNQADNCCLVTGATYPSHIENVRRWAPSIPLLLPGFGKAQGGRLEDVVPIALDERGEGIIANFSRDILFAWKGAGAPVEAAVREARRRSDQINKLRRPVTT